MDWTYKSVKYILQNPVYLGKLRGVLEGSTHYVVENANVESIIDPSTFMMVQRKLKYEKTGRKKNKAARNPFFNLCYRCGNYLVEESGFLVCEGCGGNVDSTRLVEEIKKYMVGLVEVKEIKPKNEKAYEHILDLRDRDEERLRKIKSDQKRLLMRLEEIQGSDINLAVKNRMINFNTSEAQKLHFISEEIKAKLEYLDNCDELIIETSTQMKDFMIRTPFIILYNFDCKEVVLVPHKNLFKEEGCL